MRRMVVAMAAGGWVVVSGMKIHRTCSCNRVRTAFVREDKCCCDQQAESCRGQRQHAIISESSKCRPNSNRNHANANNRCNLMKSGTCHPLSQLQSRQESQQNRRGSAVNRAGNRSDDSQAIFPLIQASLHGIVVLIGAVSCIAGFIPACHRQVILSNRGAHAMLLQKIFEMSALQLFMDHKRETQLRWTN